MRLPLKYQIIVLIILILPCLGFTISPFGRTTTTITETVKSLSQRNHVFFVSTSDSTGNVNSDNEEEEDDDDDDDDNNDYTKTVSVSILSEVPLWKRVVFFYKYKKTNDDDDGLTFKQKLANMGLSALLSYGFVSNMSYCVSVGLAWFGFSKQTGLSPLAPGQWKKFLAVYAGFYVFNNIVRPIRLAISVGVTPYFDKAVARVQRKTGLKKSLSIGIVVFLANICGTTSLMGLAIWIASIAAGVPIRSK
mmetsp:Transcript_45821/g.51089  ORF Transcript_45821/g.51089 Transcript_45821/m.51089 type:complete len:249 (-) Transcript_45821:282-1028(-)